MVSIGIHHPFDLGFDEGIAFGIFTRLHIRLRAFSLNHDALEISGGKGALRRAPGMKPNEVQPV